MASAVNIQKLTYHLTPDALTQLSSAFRSSGYYDQHRAVVYALRRADAAKLMQEWKLRHDPASLIAWLFNSLLFDATCQYGMNRARPLWGLGISWLTFSIIYLLVINRADGPGVYIVTSRTPNREHRYRLKARTVLAGSPWLHPLAVLRSQSRAAATAMLFSAMSAFNIGFKEIDFGRWIRLLMPAEFDLKPTGWVRSVAGVQSLISLYLLALWVLAYFGAPFD